jgi:hypothetical protein
MFLKLDLAKLLFFLKKFFIGLIKIDGTHKKSIGLIKTDGTHKKSIGLIKIDGTHKNPWDS